MGVTNFDIIQANEYRGLPLGGGGSDGPTTADQGNTGAVFYVNNSSSGLLSGAKGGSNGNDGLSPLTPFATIDFAIGKCSADRGDTIYVMPGHTQDISAAAFIAIDVAGIEIIGVGVGETRPVLTFSDTAATITMTANNTKFKNFVITPSIDSVVNAIVVTGNGCEVDVEVVDASNAIEFQAAIRLDTADDAKVNLRYNGFTTGNALTSAIIIDNSDNVRIFIDAYGVNSVSWVDCRDAASTNLVVSGYCYTQGITDGSQNVTDTITGSTWYADIVDGSAGSRYTGGSSSAMASDDVSSISAAVSVIDAFHDVPLADSADNVVMSDVIGNKTDTNAGDSVLSRHLVQTADAVTNTNMRDVVGNKADAAAAGAVSATESLMAYTKQIVGATLVEEYAVSGSTAVMVNANNIFTIAGGPIEVVSLVSVCVTGNDATASTIQYSHNPTDGAATTFSAASASLASALAGANVVLQGTTLATAPVLNASGAGINAVGGTSIILQAGTIDLTIGVGSTTGTWKHYLRYKPLVDGVTVTAT